MKEFVGESPQKLSKFLARVYPALSYSAFRKLLRKRDIKVDGVRVGEDCTVGPGSVVQVYYDARPPIPVLFEDENLLVADKPRGIVAEEIAALFREEGKEIIPVHRLDRNTRGILLFAKNAAAEKALTDGFRARAFEKYYRARVYGVPAKRHACLTAYLVKDAARGFVKIYDEKVPRGAEIRTEYELERDNGDGTSTLLVRLHTGKTHQIRAHLAHIGHFIVGDGKYGKAEINRRYGEKSQALAAVRLVLHFPPDSPLSQYEGKEFKL